MTISPPLLLSWTSDRLSMICNWQHCTVGCSLSFGQRAFLKDKKLGKLIIYFCSFPFKCSKECPPSPWTALLVLPVDVINVVTKRIMYRLHISCNVIIDIPPQNQKWFETENNPSQRALPFITPFKRALTLTCPARNTSRWRDFFSSNLCRQHNE